MRTAASSGSSSGIGSLNRIITPSPAKCSIVPSCASTMRPSAAWYSRSTPMTSSGSAVSEKAVKPRKSVNTTVISRRWVFSGSSTSPERIRSPIARRNKALQPGEAIDLGHLLRHALLEVGIERRQLVVQRLHPQQRLHAREQLRLIDRLGQEIVGAGLDSLDPLLLRVEGGAHHHRQQRRSPVPRGCGGRPRSPRFRAS